MEQHYSNSDEQENIEQTLRQWSDAVKQSDIEKIATLVTDQAVFWTHGAPEIEGREALKQSFEPVFNQYNMNQDFQLEEIIISGDFAFIRGVEINRLESLEDDETTLVRQRAFSVMKRGSDGRWRFHRGMTNLPPEQ